jgi:hypothetical protein
VLDAGEQFAHIGGQVLAEDHAEQRVEFIDVAHGGDARRVLGGARTVAEAGGAGIAGAGVDFREAVSHGGGTGIPAEFRALETIFRPQCVCAGIEEIDELAALTGLPQQELAAFRPQRLALHEIIIRVTADIAVAEGDEEEDFGRNFRRIASKIHDDHVLPHMDGIADAWADLGRRSDALVRQLLAEILFAPPPVVRRGWFSRWRAHKRPAAREESAAERDYRIVAACKAMGLAERDPLRRAACKSLYRVLGAIAGKRGRLGADSDLLAKLVARHVCNSHGSRVIGQLIAPMVAAAIEREGYARVATQEKPVLVSLKGASAAGKSSLRPMLKQLLREQGMAKPTAMPPSARTSGAACCSITKRWGRRANMPAT